MLSIFNQTQKGILFAFLGFTAFSVADACAKWLGNYYETAHVVFWTYYLALIFGLIFSPFLGGFKKTIQTKKLGIHIVRGVSACAISFLAISALQEISLAMLYTILFLSPFLITIVAWPIFKEPVPFKNWIIIAVGFSGVLVAFRPDITVISEGMVYAFAALGVGVCLALLSRPLTSDESLLSLSFYPAMVVTVILGGLYLPDMPIPDTPHVPVFILNGLCVIGGLSGIAYGYRIAPFSVIAPVQYTQMIMGVIFGYFIFNNTPDLWMMAGAGIIIVSGIMLVAASPKTPNAS